MGCSWSRRAARQWWWSEGRTPSLSGRRRQSTYSRDGPRRGPRRGPTSGRKASGGDLRHSRACLAQLAARPEDQGPHRRRVEVTPCANLAPQTPTDERRRGYGSASVVARQEQRLNETENASPEALDSAHRTPVNSRIILTSPSRYGRPSVWKISWCHGSGSPSSGICHVDQGYFVFVRPSTRPQQ
jgi:hypothetical protein